MNIIYVLNYVFQYSTKQFCYFRSVSTFINIDNVINTAIPSVGMPQERLNLALVEIISSW